MRPNYALVDGVAMHFPEGHYAPYCRGPRRRMRHLTILEGVAAKVPSILPLATHGIRVHRWRSKVRIGAVIGCPNHDGVLGQPQLHEAEPANSKCISLLPGSNDAESFHLKLER